MWIKIGSLLMFLGVSLGAFGAHALRGKLDVYGIDIFKTAVLYHFIHAIGILIVGVLSKENSNLNLAALFFILGIVLFSGSLYLLSVTGIKWLGAITPLGGLAFLAGWLYLFANIK
jgi:uncharacterized membrane protein YgdD (TMEM256/DUF423 family)